VTHWQTIRLSDFDDWARAHHGLLPFAASGMSRSAWYRALESGTLLQVHPKVARLPGTTVTPEQRILAAVYAVGPTATASHRSAARLWGIPRPEEDPVDVIDSRTGCQSDLEGVFIHRPSDRARLSPQRRYGIPCTNVIRALADLGAVDRHGVSAAVGHVLATRLADLGALETAAREHSRRGRPNRQKA
jgi:hypothetical protein